MAITVNQFKSRFTQAIVDVYQERIKPTSFLRSMFPYEYSPTRYLEIDIERMGEKVSVDMPRKADGTRNAFSKMSNTVLDPPFWHEYFDMTDEDLYDRVLGSEGMIQAPIMAELLNKVADRTATLQDKIERAKELQCAQALLYGIVSSNVTGPINFQRKAASMVDLSANGGYWTSSGTNPYNQIEAGCTFIRTVGRTDDALYNIILGNGALDSLLTLASFLTRQNLFNMALDTVVPPQRTESTIGAAYHGTLTAGSYKVQLWTYPQFYDLNTGTLDNPTYVATPYIPNNMAILVPTKPRFKYGGAAVPQLIDEPGMVPVGQGEYFLREFLDRRLTSHEVHIASAGIPILTAVDTVYTMKVQAS
jgi:hypothetical protein